MFSGGYIVWLVCWEQSKDRLREAERYRLVRQALAGRQGRARFLRRALIWLGRCLVVWGRRLQERYGVVADPSTLCAANQAGKPSR